MSGGAERPALLLGGRGMVLGWHGPLGPAVARFSAWSRERPEEVVLLARPAHDRPATPALAWVEDAVLAAYREDDGARTQRLEVEGAARARSSVAHLAIEGADRVALAGDTLVAGDGQGLLAVRLGPDGAPREAPRRLVSERRDGVLLAVTPLRDEVLVVSAYPGDAAWTTVSLRGDRASVVRHPAPRPITSLHVHAAGGRAGVALVDDEGEVRFALVGAEGRVVERPHRIFEQGVGRLASPAVVFVERHFRVLARREDDDSLLVLEVGEGGARFSLPRVRGPFAATYHADHLYALELFAEGDDARMHLWRCDKTGSVPQQRTDLVETDADGSRRATLDARRTILELGERLGRDRAGYRGERARVLLEEDALLARVVDAEGQLSLSLAQTEEGFTLRVSSALGEDTPLPAPPSSLVRLARWVLAHLRGGEPTLTAEEEAFAERLAEGLEAEVCAFDRAGSALVIELALPALPDVERLHGWVQQLRHAQRDALAGPAEPVAP